MLDGASGLFNPDDPESVKDYERSFVMGLPSREQVMRAKFDKSGVVQTQLLMIDTDRERNNEIGRNYTHPELKFGECLISEKYKPNYYDPETASKYVLLKFPV